MKKKFLEQQNRKYKEIIIPFAYEELRRIEKEADRLYRNKEISLRARELIRETMAEKNYHSIIIGIWSLLLPLTEKNLKKVKSLTYTLTSNVFLFDLFDDLVDKWKISKKNLLKDLYFNALIDPFRAKNKKKFSINRSMEDSSLREIITFVYYLVNEASFDKYNIPKEDFLDNLCLNEIERCAKSQFIIAIPKKYRKNEISRFVKGGDIKKDVKRMNLPIDNIASFLLISGTPISALFFKSLQIVEGRKFITSKQEIAAARDLLLLIKIINVAGDQIKDKYYDKQMKEWSYAGEINLDIFWFKKMIFTMWNKLRNKDERVYSPLAFVVQLLVRYYIGSLLYVSIKEEKCGDSIVFLVTQVDPFGNQ